MRPGSCRSYRWRDRLTVRSFPFTYATSRVRLASSDLRSRRIGSVLQNGVTDKSGSSAPSRSGRCVAFKREDASVVCTPPFDLQREGAPVGCQPPDMIQSEASVGCADHRRCCLYIRGSDDSSQPLEAFDISATPQ